MSPDGSHIPYLFQKDLRGPFLWAHKRGIGSVQFGYWPVCCIWSLWTVQKCFARSRFKEGVRSIWLFRLSECTRWTELVSNQPNWPDSPDIALMIKSRAESRLWTFWRTKEDRDQTTGRRLVTVPLLTLEWSSFIFRCKIRTSNETP